MSLEVHTQSQTLSTVAYRLSEVLHPRDDRSIRRLK